MTLCSTPRSSRRTSLFALLAVLCAISLSCSTLTGLVPTAGVETAEPGVQQGATPPTTGEGPTVLGYVLDPDGAPVAYASVGDEIADRNGVVSGDLTGSGSGWLEVQSLGHAIGYAKPGEAIGGTAVFEARQTPFSAFLPLEPGGEAVLTLGDVAQPVAEVSVSAESVSEVPAYVEAAIYDLVDVGPRFAGLSSGERLDLKLALAVEAMSAGLQHMDLASGKTASLKVLPSPNLPAEPVMAIFDPETGLWETQPDACAQGKEGVLECALPRFAPLIGFFGPGGESTSIRSPGLSLVHRLGYAYRTGSKQAPTDDDQAYQEAMADVEAWAYVGQGQVERTGSVSPEWEAEMTNRLGKLADAAEAYAESHPDESGISHLLGAAQAAMTTDNQPIVDKLLEEAKAAAEAMADELLKESDCGRIHEMLHMAQQLILLGSQAKADALIQKTKNMFDCDIWTGTIYVWLTLSSSQPGLDSYAEESGGQTWMETHKVTMTTNIQTYVLKGEDRVTVDFGEVRYGKKDRYGCHNYLTHAAEGGDSIYLNFDGTYDGYTFTVGDLQTTGGSATITYGSHAEHWNTEKKTCEEIADQTVPAPNYTSVLRHGFSGSPPITMQEMLQGGDNTNIGGTEKISNDAVQLGIIPADHGYVIWSFYHVKKVLPVKQ